MPHFPAATPSSAPASSSGPGPPRVAVVLTAVGLLLGIVSTVEVYRAGHSGAKATWHDVKPGSGEGGESGGDGD